MAADVEYQLIFRNATIADGTGGPLAEGDVAVQDGKPVFGHARETNLSWRDPRLYYANFVVTAGQPTGQAAVMSQALLTAFGRPARTYRFEAYTVRVWDTNLLRVLGGAGS